MTVRRVELPVFESSFYDTSGQAHQHRHLPLKRPNALAAIAQLICVLAIARPFYLGNGLDMRDRSTGDVGDLVIGEANPYISENLTPDMGTAGIKNVDLIGGMSFACHTDNIARLPEVFVKTRLALQISRNLTKVD